jgi:neutral ceramidase
MKAGISEISITPEQSLRVAGMLNPPKAQGTHWPLYARCFVFEGARITFAIVVLDNLMLAPAIIPGFRAAITQGSGLAPENVMIACTHTHRAPFAAALMDEEIDFDYVDWMQAQSAAVVRRAMDSLQPAQLRVAHIQTPGWTFNRRQVYRSQHYGEQVGTQGPQKTPAFVRNEGPEDNEIKTLLVENPRGACLGGLVNFACHATVMGGEPVYSADYAGPLTEALAGHFGGIFGFLQGAAGNLWAIDSTQFTDLLARDYMGPEHAQSMGTALANQAIQSLDAGHRQPVQGEQTGVARRVLSIPQRKVTRAQVDLAQGYLEGPQPAIDQQAFTRQIYGHDYTFYNNAADVQKWFARETIGMWEWQRRSGVRQPAEDVEIQVMRLGDCALVGLPGEIFTEFGLQIKAESSFRETFVVELANGWHGYIPTRAAFEHGGYETRLGYTSRLAPEAGERMVQAALEQLNRLNSD